MHSYGWLIAIFIVFMTAYASPTLPHFELQQNSEANAPLAKRSVQSTCKRIAVLTTLLNTAINQTSLDAMLADNRLTQEQVDYIETKDNAINSELQELSSNTTLIAECDAIIAHQKTVKDCKRLDKLGKLVKLANNKTAYDEHLTGELLNQK